MNTNENAACKIYARRDSATSVLRKMGIQSRDYNLFIVPMADGQFACQVAMAEMHLESLKQTKAKVAASASARKVKPAQVEEVHVEHIRAGRRAVDPVVDVPVATTGKQPSIGSIARQAIRDGMTNKEVWNVLKQRFNLDDNKKHYPAWYRSEMKRRGMLPPEA